MKQDLSKKMYLEENKDTIFMQEKNKDKIKTYGKLYSDANTERIKAIKKLYPGVRSREKCRANKSGK